MSQFSRMMDLRMGCRGKRAGVTRWSKVGQRPAPRLGLALVQSLSKPELFLWSVFLGLAIVTIVWGYG